MVFWAWNLAGTHHNQVCPIFSPSMLLTLLLLSTFFFFFFQICVWNTNMLNSTGRNLFKSTEIKHLFFSELQIEMFIFSSCVTTENIWNRQISATNFQNIFPCSMGATAGQSVQLELDHKVQIPLLVNLKLLSNLAARKTHFCVLFCFLSETEKWFQVKKIFQHSPQQNQELQKRTKSTRIL